ncbi:MAG TPA: primosomal protein N' [Candidatus Acidoferrales bacterium]|nr:primosomal protein N' [Candidatus Acidoferrales bacterium]
MIARVSLEIALRREFDYAIPPALAGQVDVGSRVQVPFGPRKILGVVTAVAEESGQANLKPILKLIGRQTLVTPKVLRLARWMGEYYCCAPEIALKAVLPEAVRSEEAGWRERLFVRPLPRSGEFPKLPKRQREVWNLVEERREIPLAELVELAETTAATVRKLEDRGLIEITSEISERDPYAKEHILPSQPLALNPAQAAALEQITRAMDAAAGPGGPGGTGVPPETRETRGLPPGANALPSATPQPKRAGSRFHAQTFLLHGVTGSGKTEIYLQAIAHALERGQGAIVLVPEISLTPQTVERFKARFSSGKLQTLVAVLHSHLSAGERHDEWHKIRQGRARIVIGARSAIFAPVEPLGLIVVDEEHEHTYKQEEAPRYHARDVAVMRGQMEQAVVVLGSATPSLESYYNCRRGKFALLELPQRVDDQKMPQVRVVDMRQARRDGKGAPIFSPQLKEAITQRLERKEQTILFLNRRGYSSSLVCERCGQVCGCPNCSLALTYHRPEAALRCHICGYNEQVPQVCPNEKCRNPGIRYSGMGTQKVEEVLGKLFPNARVQRMDADVMRRKDDYRRVLGEFRAGKIDILVGTQMIAKGLHFPNVTLVGIIFADMALHLPDFRAGERTFQLLTQVAGRAGRGDLEGEVFVQAFTPFHPAIQYARRHDFVGFYEQEMEFREQLKYPPVGRAALLTLKGRNEDKVKFSADFVKRAVESKVSGQTLKARADETGADAERGLSDLLIAGPAPAPLLRAENLYRYHILLRTRAMSRLSQMLAQITTDLTLPEDVTLAVDIDPVDLG